MNYPLATTTWDDAEYGALHSVIASGNFTMGEKVKEFEQEFSSKFRTDFAVMSNSGSSANLLALAAIRYSSKNPGMSRNEVIVPAVSWSTTYYPITQLGFKLRFVDVDLETLNASAEAIQAAIGPKTAGIVVVNLLGNPSELSEIRALADESDLFMIEDNCESLGATYDGRPAGTFGDIGTFSSFFSHHISTMEGGVSLTKSLELKQVMTSLRAHGWTRELPAENHVHDKTGNNFDDLFRFVLPGYNLRPLEMSGAIGVQQIKKIDLIISGRRANAQKFHAIMLEYPEIRIQKELGQSSWFGFSLILRESHSGQRSEFLKSLDANSVAVRPIVGGNFTRHPVMKHLPHVPLVPLSNADTVHDDGLFIGNHHYTMEKEFDLLKGALDSFLGR